jgi:chromosome partitioning protein
MKIALIANKGGVGKTTLCLLLHEAIRQTGQTVAVRDLDNIQGTSSKALAAFGGTREQPEKPYDVLLIDTPPSLGSPSTAAATSQSDIILIPSTPSPADVWEADKALQFARRKKPSALVRVVINRVKTATLLAAALEESLKGMPLLPTRISDRQGYQHLLLSGWSALDAKAANESLKFLAAVMSIR